MGNLVSYLRQRNSVFCFLYTIFASRFSILFILFIQTNCSTTRWHTSHVRALKNESFVTKSDRSFGKGFYCLFEDTRFILAIISTQQQVFMHEYVLYLVSSDFFFTELTLLYARYVEKLLLLCFSWPIPVLRYLHCLVTLPFIKMVCSMLDTEYFYMGHEKCIEGVVQNSNSYSLSEVISTMRSMYRNFFLLLA